MNTKKEQELTIQHAGYSVSGFYPEEMSNNDAKKQIEELLAEKWFQNQFGGGIVEEALKVAIKALSEKEA